MERKKKEDAEKKLNKKPEDTKNAPGLAKQNTKPGKDDDKDDPIDKSLKERVAAGGVTQVVSKPGQSGPKLTTLPTGLKKPGDKLTLNK